MDVTQIALTAAITSLVGAVVGAIVTAVVTTVKDKKRGDSSKEQARDNASKLLLMDKTKYLTQCAVDAGEISIHQRSFIHEMIDTAHALGANGEMTQCGIEIDRLPTSRDNE